MKALNFEKLKSLKLPFKKKASLDATKARSGYIFVLPFLLGIAMIYLPILIDSIWFTFNTLGLEFVNGAPQMTLKPEGFYYYREALLANPDFVTTLLGGIQQLIFEVPAIIIFALFIAVVLNQKMLGRAVFRAIFFVPVIISTGCMGAIMAQDIVTDNMQGGMNDGSGAGGMDASAAGTNQIINSMEIMALFAEVQVASELILYVVGLVNDIYAIINYSGVQMLIFLAGLQAISPSIYEACEIEGATAWETFWKVTFPMISPMILVNAIYTIIDGFTKQSNTVMTFIENNYAKSNEGATAMAWIYFIVVILIIAVVAGIASTFIFYQRRD